MPVGEADGLSTYRAFSLDVHPMRLRHQDRENGKSVLAGRKGRVRLFRIFVLSIAPGELMRPGSRIGTYSSSSLRVVKVT